MPEIKCTTLHMSSHLPSCQMSVLIGLYYTANLMKKFAVLDKRVGETPLTVIREWKRQNMEYIDVPASYAGRLDPMASGKLLVLLGDECKRQREYTNLDKEYEIEVLLDIGSDTGDVLGIPEYSTKESDTNKENLDQALHKEVGAHMRKYPAFSSKTVNGKPLFLHALEGTLSYIKMPEHIEKIYSIKHINSYGISNTDLKERISKLLDLVPRTNEPSKRLGEDFRVDVIRERWAELFNIAQERSFDVISLRVTCASGTYMRSLAGRIGESLGTRSLAFSIRRTKIGRYVPICRRIFSY